MSDPRSDQLRTLKFWWMAELFSPQSVPNLTPQSAKPVDRQVIEWRPGEPLPWESLPKPPPLGKKPRTWQHKIYLGVYKLEATYDLLHRAFHEDRDAYDERPGKESACAGLLIDAEGRVVDDSAILSSALWGVARIHDPGPTDPGWMLGFDEATVAFEDAIARSEGIRRDDTSEELPLPQDEDSLAALPGIAHSSAGISELADLATDRIVIDSSAVLVDGSDEPGLDFLNSFFLDDLATVRTHAEAENIGAAMDQYLTDDGALSVNSRADVIRNPEVVMSVTSLDRLPLGRWPSNPHHSLALSQQFAVNEILGPLAASRGLIGVNGPPGTGKTTMLRDIVAGNVVERARRLTRMANPHDAFTDVEHVWKSGEYPRKIRELRPELTGFEMVVASANNTAVENITTEIPARKAIDEIWREDADYFSAIATEILHNSGEGSAEAWGLTAARLGRKSNRSAFRTAFWFDLDNVQKSDPKYVPRMQTRLQRWRDGKDPVTPWHKARETFTQAVRRVEELVEQRTHAATRLQDIPAFRENVSAQRKHVDRIRTYIQHVEQDLTRHLSVEHTAETNHANALARHDQHLAIRPNALETVFSFGRSMREWRSTHTPLATALRHTDQHRHDTLETGRRIRAAREHATRDLNHAEDSLTEAQNRLSDLLNRCADDAARFGKGYPGPLWVGDQRELHAPWLDAEIDTARSELFLAALDLHTDFFANTAHAMLDGLRAALEVVAGQNPSTLEPEKLRAAWQLFFLVIPLVSTTFASASRMFGGLGRESIGWLLIDEAGQACPQHAAGTIWRAQRVVAVGDPLQLQPVVTIPQKTLRDIAFHFGVSETWVPPRASVQTLADRVATYGTTLQQGEENVWVSAPLRVHRRCDDPMFTLCNRIAYNGIMVNGVHRRLNDPTEPDRFDDALGEPKITVSFWADEPARTPGNHVQQEQFTRFDKAMDHLKEQGIDASEIIAIAPFRAVADRLESLSEKYPGLRAGTIHRAQGREAPVVILMLSADPAKPGAKAWASSTVNLLNVAASRAQRRLYVIGDQASWELHNHFRELSSALRWPQQAPPEDIE